MADGTWSVAVIKSSKEKLQSVLLSLYGFMKDLEGVKNLHFMIRDRVEDEIVISFRVLAAEKAKEIVKSKMNYKLNELVPDKFVIDPGMQNPLSEYVVFGAEKRLSPSGVDKFPEFCSLLSKMSGLVIEMLRNDYFSSAERVELAHVMSWMLGYTEYGIVTTKHFEIGYYDRIEDKYCRYQRQDFPQAQKKT
jgi:hypothetical protein